MQDDQNAAAGDPTELETRILLVDDHTLFAEGLTLLLRGLASRVSVMHAASCEQALSVLEVDSRFALILLDLALPGSSHRLAFEQVRSRAPGIPLVAISAEERPSVVAELLRAGARGCIPKSTSAEVTLSALRLVLAGGTYVPPMVVLESSPRELEERLTSRELDVLELLAQGLSSKEMAEALSMAESTVRVHVASILRRLALPSRREAATSPRVLALLAERGGGPSANG